METRKFTALVFGSSGLVGKNIVSQLLTNPHFEKVILFNRKSSTIRHPKITEHLIHFNDEKNLKEQIHGDILFCCLGSTIKKAGSKEAFQEIDLVYPERIAQLASANGVKSFLLISSVGANAHSENFYLQTKGKCENAIRKFPFAHYLIFRPSLLIGKRNEFRPGEAIAQFLMPKIKFLFFGRIKKYAPVKAELLASFMIHSSLTCQKSYEIFENDEINSFVG